MCSWFQQRTLYFPAHLPTSVWGGHEGHGIPCKHGRKEDTLPNPVPRDWQWELRVRRLSPCDVSVQIPHGKARSKTEFPLETGFINSKRSCGLWGPQEDGWGLDFSEDGQSILRNYQNLGRPWRQCRWKQHTRVCVYVHTRARICV